MTEGATEKIPFAVEVSRMIELLASQIYPSPFALLRENIQSSFDATLLRRHMGQPFNPKIEVTIETTMIRVADNGVGFSPDKSASQDSVGLQIVQALVDQLSGKLSWANGQGTCATITFPEINSS